MTTRIPLLLLTASLLAGFMPFDEPRTFTASYYATGKITANGEAFDPQGLTAAHRRFAFGTLLRVVNTSNNLAVVVRVNDRGPYIDGRSLDLTIGAAERLGMLHDGLATVAITVVE